MYVDVESYKSLVYYAAWALDQDATRTPRCAVSMRQGLCAVETRSPRLGIDARPAARRRRVHLGVRRAALPEARQVGAPRSSAMPTHHYDRRRHRRTGRCSRMDFELSPRGRSLPRGGPQASSTRTCRPRASATAPSCARLAEEGAREALGRLLLAQPRSAAAAARSCPAGDPQGRDGASAEGAVARQLLHGARLGRPGDRDRVRHRGAEAEASSRTSSTASTSGAPATPSPTPAATSPRSSARCVREGDEYVVNGQKIWTSIAMWSKWMILLVRTSTRTPGRTSTRASPACWSRWTARGSRCGPIENMAGGAMFAEVFFTDVRVPGREPPGRRGPGLAGDGLGACARALGHRRVPRPDAQPRDPEGPRAKSTKNGPPAIEDPGIRRRLAVRAETQASRRCG